MSVNGYHWNINGNQIWLNMTKYDKVWQTAYIRIRWYYSISNTAYIAFQRDGMLHHIGRATWFRQWEGDAKCMCLEKLQIPVMTAWYLELHVNSILSWVLVWSEQTFS